MDLEHIAMMGHSFGAAATIVGLADDKRLKYSSSRKLHIRYMQ